MSPCFVFHQLFPFPSPKPQRCCLVFYYLLLLTSHVEPCDVKLMMSRLDGWVGSLQKRKKVPYQEVSRVLKEKKYCTIISPISPKIMTPKHALASFFSGNGKKWCLTRGKTTPEFEAFLFTTYETAWPVRVLVLQTRYTEKERKKEKLRTTT